MVEDGEAVAVALSLTGIPRAGYHGAGFQGVIEMKVFLAAAAVAVVGMSASVAEAKPASCSLVIAERDVFDGTCDFDGDADGSFRLTYAGKNFFVYVNVDEPGKARGYWNGWEQASHAHEDLGMLTRERSDGACWSNGYARVCAR